MNMVLNLFLKWAMYPGFIIMHLNLVMDLKTRDLLLIRCLVLYLMVMWAVMETVYPETI